MLSLRVFSNRDGRQRVPILSDVYAAVAFCNKEVTGRKLPDVLKESLWRGRGEKRQVVIKRLFVNVGGDIGMLQDGFDFRSENEAAVLMTKIEWLNADAIANEDEFLFFRIPKSDRVVAFQMVNKVEAAFFVKMQDAFGVCAGV